MPITSEHEVAVEPRPRRKKHSWWVAALLVGAVLLVSGFATNMDTREAHALQSPGAIVAVTAGNESLELGTTWQKWLLRKYPSLADHLGGTSAVRQGVGVQDLVVWRNDPRGWIWTGPPNGLLLLTDDQGRTRELPVNGPTGSYVIHGWYNVHPIVTVKLADLPTDCKMLRLRLKPLSAEELEHEEFRMPNPCYRP